MSDADSFQTINNPNERTTSFASTEPAVTTSEATSVIDIQAESPTVESNNTFHGLLSSFSPGRHLPPSYEEANDPNAPPPSYESLFGRVREVRKSSNGFIDFIKNLFFYLLGKIGLIAMIGLTIIVPVCMLVIGAVYFKECPAEPYIPIYLIVGGAFGLLKQMLTLKLRSRQARQADLEVPDSSLTASLKSLINSFLLCWFITGCYWVYHVYEPDHNNKEAENYCNRVLYVFAFWLLTSTYIFVGVVILLLCCISSTALFLTGDHH